MQAALASEETAFERLERDWNELVSASEMDNPFMQWEWCHTWWRHYGVGRSLALVLLHDNGRLVGLAPLYMEPGRPGSRRKVAFLGSGEVCSEYQGFVLRRGWEERGMRCMLDFLLEGAGIRWGQLQLRHMSRSGLIAAALESYLSQRHRSYRIEARQRSWQVHLTSPWEDLLRQLPRHRRERYRQAKRDLEKHDLEFHEVGGEEEIESAWSDLVRLHEARWALEGHRGCFESARFAAFHSDLLRPLWRRNMLSLNTLRCHNQAVAASYCLRHNGVVYFYQAGLDPQWMHARPGHVLRYCEIKQAAERGDGVFDFLSGDEPYKALWGTHSTPMWNLYVAGRGLVPSLVLGFQSSVAWFKDTTRAHLSESMQSTVRRWKNRRNWDTAVGRGPSVAGN